MKRLIQITILLAIIFSMTSFSSASSYDDIVGEVIWEGNGCDYYIIETKRYFVLIERYNGNLYEGDKVKGELHSYNFKNITNLSRNDSKVKVWIENYWVSKESCFDWLKENEKCGFEE